MSETRFVFTTDNKVKMHSSEVGINDKLSSIIGEKFIEYILKNLIQLKRLQLYQKIKLMTKRKSL